MKRIGRFAGNAIRESFDNLPSGIAFFDRNGLPVLCNRQMYRLAFALTGREFQSSAELRGIFRGLPESSGAKRDGSTFLLPDGSEWKFTITETADESGAVYTQAVASDVTGLWNGFRKLTESNQKLEEMAAHLRQMSANVVAAAREEEILSMKMRVHNEMGASVLNTRRFFLGGCDPGQKAELLSHWEKTLGLLRNEIGKDDETDLYGELLSAASAIGAEIVRTGELPENPAAALTMLAAIRECLTNTIRHAGGNRVFVLFTQDGGSAAAVITNDGRPPEKEITEGGGLSALRERIERCGGTMRVQSLPAFALRVSVPLKGENET